jgi:hypothetical protein
MAKDSINLLRLMEFRLLLQTVRGMWTDSVIIALWLA